MWLCSISWQAGTRLFGFVGAGATLGQLIGSLLAVAMAHLGPGNHLSNSHLNLMVNMQSMSFSTCIICFSLIGVGEVLPFFLILSKHSPLSCKFAP